MKGYYVLSFAATYHVRIDVYSPEGNLMYYIVKSTEEFGEYLEGLSNMGFDCRGWKVD